MGRVARCVTRGKGLVLTCQDIESQMILYFIKFTDEALKFFLFVNVPGKQGKTYSKKSSSARFLSIIKKNVFALM